MTRTGFATLLALALALAPLAARAQDASFAESPATAEARARYDASETGYARTSASDAGASGFAGQLQQLVAAGQSAQASQLVAARDGARSSLESAIAGYLGALKTQLDQAQAAGQSDVAQAILARVADLRARLQGVVTDAVNDRLAAQGFGRPAAANGTTLAGSSAPAANANASAGTTGTGGYGLSNGPATAPAAPAPLAAPAPATLDPGPVAGSGDQKTQAPAGKPRKATGRLVAIARTDSREATRERLARALELLRAGKPLEPVAQGEVYLVERWREPAPVWIRLAADEAHAPELAKLAAHPGATCSVTGTVDSPTPAKGEVVLLRAWKITALAAGERLATGATKPAPVKKPTPEKRADPGPLEEDFND